MCDYVLGSRFNVTTNRKESCVYSSTTMQNSVHVHAKENIFSTCKTMRTQKRVKNGWSSEQAGTCGTYVRTMRFENSYITKVCKSRNMY